MQTLGELLQRLDEFDRQLTIYAERPWTAESRAEVRWEDPGESTLETSDGLSYFLEVSVAREEIAAHVAPDAVVETTIHYAEHDAFPE